MKRIVVFLFLLLEVLSAYAQKTEIELSENGFYFRYCSNRYEDIAHHSNYDVEGLYVISSTNEGDVVIPSSVTIDGIQYDVVGIEDRAFYKKDGLTSITIPNTVRVIGHCYTHEVYNSYPYRNCNARPIGTYGAFEECSNLSKVIFEPNSKLSLIGNETFANCNSLSSIIIPENVSWVAACAFYGCSALDSIVFMPIDNCYIGYSSFNLLCDEEIFDYKPQVFIDSCHILFNGYKCYDLHCTNREFRRFSNRKILYNGVDVISVNDINYKITSYENRTLSVVYGSYEGSIEIPSNVTINGTDYTVNNVDTAAFIGCSKITSISLPNTIQKIGDWAFYDCCNLKEIIVPYGVSSIGFRSFDACANLETVVLPESITDIGASAFCDCWKLETINIPPEVMIIGGNAFRNCYGLQSVELPDKIDTIYEQTFLGCEKLISVTLPSNLKKIGIEAFHGCKIRDLIIPSSVTEIGSYAFSGSSISSVTFPVGASSMGESAFEGCSIMSVTIPYGITSIGSYAFSDSKILSITIPESVTSIEANAFSNCRVSSITLPDGVSSIGNDAFYNSSIQNINIPANDTIIGDRAFYGCNNLTSINLPYNLKHIGKDAFYGCSVDTLYMDSYSAWCEVKKQIDSNLKVVFIGDNITNIEEDSFARYDSIRNVYFSSSVEQISARAFVNCKSLSSIFIPAGVETIGSRAFEGCTSLKKVTFEGSPDIGYNAFWNCPNIETVESFNTIPGRMEMFDVPQPIMVGGYDDINLSSDLSVTSVYNDALKRSVSKIESSRSLSWSCVITTDNITAGAYRVKLGVLTSPDSLPNYFNVKIYGITELKKVCLFDSVATITYDLPIGNLTYPFFYSNDCSGYDSVLITESFDIPDDYKRIRIEICSGVSDFNRDIYSSTMLLDRVFFEPLDEDIPSERYSGPFVESVFNNATLTVPEETVDEYRVADGWKLFNYIDAYNAVIPIIIEKDQKGQKFGDGLIYDVYGRSVNSESIELLPSGIYIIDGKKYLLK